MNPSQASTPAVVSPQYWAIVPAAGIGARMCAAKPKQYLPLAGKTIIEQTLERLLQLPFLTGIVVAIASDDDYWPELNISRHPKIHRVTGGAERADSVLSALNFLQGKLGEQDWVMVHDAARPCVELASIEILCAQLGEDPVGGILALPVTDTVKKVGADNAIECTIDRRVLWQAQTPQLFRFQLLRDCLSQTLARNENITDEASAVELCGFTAKVVESTGDNIKVTRPGDLALAEFILHKQANRNS
jgi:2-C-methyl-D-erythritol 4-phosphate cytidylyltransferase